MDYDKTRIKVLGHGEIGQSLCAYFNELGIKHAWQDLHTRRGHKKCYFLHVAIPYNDKFIAAVSDAIIESGAKGVVIHSTVKPGTTRKIAEMFPDVSFCYSPVIGVHPDLLGGLKTFTKWMAVSGKSQLFFHMAGIFKNWKVVYNFETVEKLKLLSTTYYGLCIAFHGEAKKILGDDFDFLSDWTTNYNKGYTKLGKENVVRPVLYAPDKIGGHCILPNVKILQEDYDSLVFDLINLYS
jgi:hypothetical protein